MNFLDGRELNFSLELRGDRKVVSKLDSLAGRKEQG